MSTLFIILLSFQLGAINGGSMNYGISPKETITVDLDTAYYIEFVIEAQILKYFFIKGILNNTFYHISNPDEINFTPDHDGYYFIAGIRFKEFEMAYRHYCFHPLFPYNGSNADNRTALEGGYDDFYIKFTMSTKGIK